MEHIQKCDKQTIKERIRNIQMENEKYIPISLEMLIYSAVCNALKGYPIEGDRKKNIEQLTTVLYNEAVEENIYYDDNPQYKFY